MNITTLVLINGLKMKKDAQYAIKMFIVEIFD